MDLWFTEKHKLGFGLTCSVKRTLVNERTPYQTLTVLDTCAFGNMLLLDGVVQTTVFDEFVYHEMIAHPALCTHPEPKRALVVGGGDGGTVREVLRHPSVESVELCEIDRRVVEVCTEHLKETSCGLTDPRVTVVYEDGIEYVKRFKAKYHCVIVDSPDPVGPATGLFAADFYRGVHESLTDDGVFATQTESPFTDGDLIRKVTRDFAAVFPICGFYTACVPTYPTGLWSFMMGSKRYHPVRNARRSEALSDCRYYTYDLHRAMFAAVPKLARDLLPESFI